MSAELPFGALGAVDLPSGIQVDGTRLVFFDRESAEKLAKAIESAAEYDWPLAATPTESDLKRWGWDRHGIRREAMTILIELDSSDEYEVVCSRNDYPDYARQRIIAVKFLKARRLIEIASEQDEHGACPIYRVRKAKRPA